MKRLSLHSWGVCVLGVLASCGLSPSHRVNLPIPTAARPEARSATFDLRQSIEVTDIPKSAKQVRVWAWLPDDDPAQKILDLSVSQAPAGYHISRDPVYGHRYLYAEANDPGESLSMSTRFTIRRSAVSIELDPTRAGELTAIHRRQFAPELRRDVPNMEVTPDIVSLAGEICGQEQNVVRQTRLLCAWVVDHTNHYSRPNAPKSSGKGSTAYCLAEKGGSCTDMHSLFISLARARGIPTRLQFGSLLKPANEGKPIDPGYRCWVEYFVPNFGWVPADLAAANTNPDRRDFYFSGLDERRVHFLEGRDLELSPPQAGPRLNLLISAYVEVDGKPHASFKRVLQYSEVKPAAVAASAGPAVIP